MTVQSVNVQNRSWRAVWPVSMKHMGKDFLGLFLAKWNSFNKVWELCLWVSVPTLTGRCSHLFTLLSMCHVSAAGSLTLFTLKLERKRVSRPKNGLSASWRCQTMDFMPFQVHGALQTNPSYECHRHSMFIPWERQTFSPEIWKQRPLMVLNIWK